jgi:hypothetical protein
MPSGDVPRMNDKDRIAVTSSIRCCLVFEPKADCEGAVSRLQIICSLSVTELTLDYNVRMDGPKMPARTPSENLSPPPLKL